MFGISFTELVLISLVALLVVGPQKLPGMLRSLGEWISKARNLTNQVREQTGIDEILRDEGLGGGINELRSILRGDLSQVGRTVTTTGRGVDPYQEDIEIDRTREYPPEGPDAYDALPDDLFDQAMEDSEPPPPLSQPT